MGPEGLHTLELWRFSYRFLSCSHSSPGSSDCYCDGQVLFHEIKSLMEPFQDTGVPTLKFTKNLYAR
jgi:hypothetical protein